MPEDVIPAVPVEETPSPATEYNEFLRTRFLDDESKDEPSKEESEPAPVEEPSKSEPVPEPGKTEEQGEPAKEAKKKGGYQRRIDKLSEQKWQLEDRARKAEERSQQLEQQLAAHSAAVQKPSSASVEDVLDLIPHVEEAKDLDAHRNDWRQFLVAFRDDIRKEVLGQVEKESRDREQRATTDQLAKSWQVRFQEAAAKYDDFEETVRSRRLLITPNMAQTFQESELGIEVLYHLGKNPKEAARISQLSDRAQIRELGKIEVLLSSQAKEPEATPAPETRKQPVFSKTPPPITPVAHTAQTAVETSAQAMEYGEWEKIRKRQLGLARR
jgi:hypothetical protein